MIQSEKLLGAKTYTLTVTTNPSSATCTLTYDGVSHSTKSAKVKAGTVISYSIYHSTYGSTSGSITMDKDKTLSCNGTYSTSTNYNYYTFSSPTSLSSNGTLGGSSFACYGGNGNSAAYKMFDGNASSYAQFIHTSSTWSVKNFVFYNPNPLNVSKLTFNFLVSNGYSCRIQKGTFYGSNNSNVASSPSTESYWTQIGATDAIAYTASANQSTSFSYTSYYKYHRVLISKASGPNGHGTYSIADIKDLTITGKYQTTSTAYTYYWDKTVS